MQPIQLLQEAAQRAGQRTGTHLPTLTRSDQGRAAGLGGRLRRGEPPL